MLRWRTTALSAGLAGALLLAGCGGADEPTPTPTATETVHSGPTVLTFQVFGPPPVVAAYTRIASDFTAANPDTVVNVRPYDSDADSRAALKAGKADLFLAERADLPDLSNDKAITPVDVLLGERDVDFGDGFQREALEAFSGDDSLLCMPTDTSPMVIYYNTRLVDLSRVAAPGEKEVSPTAGWSLEQFARAARQNSRGAVRGLYVAPTLEQLAPFVWSGGGHLIDNLREPTTLTLADGGSRSALERILELVRDPSLTFSEEQLRKTSALKLFKAGRLAMMPGFRSLTPTLREQPNLSFDVMPMPRSSRRATSGTMSGLCISSASEHADEAADFIAYAVSDDATELLARTGYVTPTNLHTANSDAFLQPGLQPASAQAFPASTRYIQRLPVGEAWERVAGTSSRLLNRLFFDPVIDPLEDRLTEIDENSARIFLRFAELAQAEEEAAKKAEEEAEEKAQTD